MTEQRMYTAEEFTNELKSYWGTTFPNDQETVVQVALRIAAAVMKPGLIEKALFDAFFRKEVACLDDTVPTVIRAALTKETSQ